jgi:hypothetical protein
VDQKLTTYAKLSLAAALVHGDLVLLMKYWSWAESSEMKVIRAA